mgnify:CR=1 FL=1
MEDRMVTMKAAKMVKQLDDLTEERTATMKVAKILIWSESLMVTGRAVWMERV